MGELKLKYKILVGTLSLAMLLPMLIAVSGSNLEYLIAVIENAPISSFLIKHYEIDINYCLKCQEGGLYFAAVSIVYMIVVILLMCSVSFIIMATIMKLLFKWKYKFTISTLLYGNYPESWKNICT